MLEDNNLLCIIESVEVATQRDGCQVLSIHLVACLKGNAGDAGGHKRTLYNPRNELHVNLQSSKLVWMKDSKVLARIAMQLFDALNLWSKVAKKTNLLL